MDSRKSAVGRAANDTCNWLLNHDIFQRWHKNRGLLWIKGKPGAGKSTLMKYAFRQFKTIAEKTSTGEILVSFFFHGRGSELQNSLLGLFRSILHQLLEEVPHLLSSLVHASKKAGEEKKEW